MGRGRGRRLKRAWATFLVFVGLVVAASVLLEPPDPESSTDLGVIPAGPSVPEADPAPAPVNDPGPFRGCYAAWADGTAPIYEDDPRYDPHWDGDGDGIACEHRP